MENLTFPKSFNGLFKMALKTRGSVQNSFSYYANVRLGKFYKLYQINRDDNESEGDESGRWKLTGLNSIYGTLGSAMQKLPGMSLKELYWSISWPMLLRIIQDLPSQEYLGDSDEEGEGHESKSKKQKPKELKEQTSSDFANYIQKLNEKNKRI